MIQILGMQDFAAIVVWTGALVFVLAAVAIAVLAIRLQQPIVALFGLLPVGLGILAIALGIRDTFPAPAPWPGLVALALAALAIIGGNPLTVWVLGRAAKGDVDGGDHGGILVAEPTAKGATSTTKTREVLRGGTWIGYLERLAVVGAIAVGHFEIVAAVIAIKGLGRFSELDAPEARERFIIGTLVSMTWAALCGALIVLPVVTA
ncbi:hypothetical protein [Pseudolysinimonas sp.]|jgi:hypothetical protein|uniref:hypothetical protein n=1 Tax=Pseudolysinimonas sp. TaxID=2680009 RepID=UPI0037835462